LRIAYRQHGRTVGTYAFHGLEHGFGILPAGVRYLPGYSEIELHCHCSFLCNDFRGLVWDILDLYCPSPARYEHVRLVDITRDSGQLHTQMS
jgi:hypothetical protein